MTEIETKFEVAQQELVDKFKLLIKDAAESVLSDLYTDVARHAVTDAHINYKNFLRDELTDEFKNEIISGHTYYSWAHGIRMLLLKHHSSEISNQIIKDLQERCATLEKHIDNIRRYK